MLANFQLGNDKHSKIIKSNTFQPLADFFSRAFCDLPTPTKIKYYPFLPHPLQLFPPPPPPQQSTALLNTASRKAHPFPTPVPQSQSGIDEGIFANFKVAISHKTSHIKNQNTKTPLFPMLRN